MRFRYWILITSGLFIAGLAIGAVVGLATPPGITDLFEEELTALEDLGTTLEPFHIGTAVFIFFKNVIALGVSFLLSPFLCLVPLLSIFLNSALISFLAVFIIQVESVALLLGGILPHGIIEIPAFIIGEAAALVFGVSIIMAIFSREKRKTLPATFKMAAKYMLLAIILLVPAAIIETYVTPLLIS